MSYRLRCKRCNRVRPSTDLAWIGRDRYCHPFDSDGEPTCYMLESWISGGDGIVATQRVAEKYGALLRAINGTPDAPIYFSLPPEVKR